MKKEDECFNKMLKSIDLVIEAPEDLKQKVYNELFFDTNTLEVKGFNFTLFLIERLLKLGIPISILVNILLNIFKPITVL